MNELQRRCLSLSKSERQKLIGILAASIEDDREDCESRFKTLHRIASDIVGPGILSRTRLFNPCFGRKMIAYQMRAEGYSLPTIGRNLIRHHASVLHLAREMEHILEYPNVYRLETAYWNEFKKQLTEYDNTHKATDRRS